MSGFELSTERAWLAGFIDGEGCIRIAKEKNPRQGIVASEYMYYLSVQISQKDPAPLCAVKEVWGGTMWCKNPEWNGGVWNYHVKSRKAAVLLVAVLPYLVLKKAQAEIGLKFQARRLDHPGRISVDRSLDEADFFAIKEAKKVVI